MKEEKEYCCKICGKPIHLYEQSVNGICQDCLNENSILKERVEDKDIIICSNCYEENEQGRKFCYNCGMRLYYNQDKIEDELTKEELETTRILAEESAISDKDWLTTLLLCIFTGGLGIHRFYVGKAGTGILYLLTAGCLGIGVLIDLIMIACGNFTDADDNIITNNKNTTSNNSQVISSADELKKYKELLDMGAITQEEFDTKKKQILNV